MKKYIGMLLFLTCLITLTACANNKAIVLPDPENVTRIDLKENSSEAVKKLTDKEEISKLIHELKNHSKATNMESINDQPANLKHYIIVQFYHKDRDENPSLAYLYRKKGMQYIEQPYVGIWKLENEMNFFN